MPLPSEKFDEEIILVNPTGVIDTTRPDLGPFQVRNPQELVKGGRYTQRYKDPNTGELDKAQYDPIAEVLKPPICINGHWEAVVRWLRRDGQELFEGFLSLDSHSIVPYPDNRWERNWWLDKQSELKR